MSGRSARVAALSDKIQGLKFMKRASTAHEPSSPASPALDRSDTHRTAASSSKQATTSSTVTNAQASSPRKATVDRNEDEQEDGNEEHWVMPPQRTPLPQHFTMPSTNGSIELQADFHSWLGQYQRQQDGESTRKTDSTTAQSAGAARKSFGAWDTKGKRSGGSDSEGEDDGDDEEIETASEEDIAPDGSDQDRAGHSSGFIKPGSLARQDASPKGSIRKKRKSEQKDDVIRDIRKDRKKHKDKHGRHSQAGSEPAPAARSSDQGRKKGKR